MTKLPILHKEIFWCLAAAWALLVSTSAWAAETASPQRKSPTPKVTAKRAGSLLTLSCELQNADGSRYEFNDDFGYGNPPKFAIYQGDQLIGSGSFEYG